MQLQKLAAGGRRERPCRELDDSAPAVSSRSTDDDRPAFDRAAPSRSRTIRCDSVSAGRRRWRLLLPRSQSVSRIDCMDVEERGDDDDVATQAGSRLRRRLDVIRSNLLSLVHSRKRIDGGRANDESDGRTQVTAVRQPETVWNGAEAVAASTEVQASSSSSSSPPTKTVFDRRRVHRRTPRRHRTVVDGQQVEAARGLLRRAGSSASPREAIAPGLPNVDVVGGRLASPAAADVSGDVGSDVTTSSAVADSACQRDNVVPQPLQDARQVCQCF